LHIYERVFEKVGGGFLFCVVSGLLMSTFFFLSCVQQPTAAAAAAARKAVLPRPAGSSVEYRQLTSFQSHEPEFDYLKSLEIEEKINKVKFCRRQNGSLMLLSTNGIVLFVYWGFFLCDF
jgi:hypothetical protein